MGMGLVFREGALPGLSSPRLQAGTGGFELDSPAQPFRTAQGWNG